MSEVFMYVTCESEDQAGIIGKALVEERLAACVNILGGMRSLYWWDGAVQQGDETVLIAKTRDDLTDAATDRIKALHPYEVPCVVCLPITGGNDDFLEWIRAETGRK
ncbi:divalent cation tolerance protein CutA [Pseudodesulfovibrio cashew]|uniref:Divalent cation tolerance protein CutA n=1 Tax=Pseudodesulfovibrio cashew TaxID=2678688 RepID=A0A6I6JDY1_9BACT|nr:divalent-cation tolerance protein CutA [Pseudodesulfovibrio cashew]QGY41056.1 divalent cation tolerance protein CutA [Pseudodesulfovibrio cashew]